MTKKLISYDDEAVGGGLPEVVKQDLSNTYATQNVVLRMVRPEDHGAKADGTTDDTAAVTAAIAAQRAAPGFVFLTPGKTYLVREIQVRAGDTIVGYGATFKRPNNAGNIRTITNAFGAWAGAVDSTNPIEISGLTIDGNMLNQGAYTAYELQQAMLMLFRSAASTGGRERVILRDIATVNSVSDGVHIAQNVYATVTNLQAVDCFRGGFVCSGGNATAELNGYRGGGTIHGAHLDIEIDATGFGGSYRLDLTMRDCIETTKSWQACQFTIRDTHVKVYDSRLLSGLIVNGGHRDVNGNPCPPGSLHFYDSEIDTYQHANRHKIEVPVDVQFVRCTIRANNPGTTATTVSALAVSHTQFLYHPTRLQLIDCEFVIGATVAGDILWAVRVDAVPATVGSTAVNFSEMRVVVRGGSVAAGYERGVSLTTGGALEMGGGHRANGTYIAQLSAGAAGAQPWLVDMGDVRIGASSQGLRIYYGHSACRLRNTGVVLDETENKLSTSQGLTGPQYLGGRTIMVSAAPTTAVPGLPGDRARIKAPVAGQPVEWVCTTPSTGTATWKAVATAAA